MYTESVHTNVLNIPTVHSLSPNIRAGEMKWCAILHKRLFRRARGGLGRVHHSVSLRCLANACEMRMGVVPWFMSVQVVIITSCN